MISRQNTPMPNRHKGFSLIEVLVTMVVVAVGLMGLISLMLKGMQANATSSQRTVAIRQAYDIADRMRANINGVNAGNYGSILPPASSSTCDALKADPEAFVEPPTSEGLDACDTTTCTDSVCNTSALAARDACAWHRANASALPNGAGAVCKEAANNWYTIYVSWNEGKALISDKTLRLRFEP